jgi:hypothetical protein
LPPKKTLQLHKSFKRRAGVQKKIHILRGSAMHLYAPDYVMKEITERYACGFRDQDKSRRHIWAFYECLPSFFMQR